MKIIDQGIGIIQSSENQLRQLVAEAANQGEYETVLKLTEWASRLASMTNGHALSASSVGGNGNTGQKFTSPPVYTAKPKSSPKAKRKPVQTTNSSDGYPKFSRVGDELVKIGWSKKSKEEYQHKAPHHVVELLVESLREASADGKMIGVHDLFPLEDPTTSSDVPSYQVYLCLAWLRDGGLIEQHGRQGYTVPGVDFLAAEVAARWNKLNENNGQ